MKLTFALLLALTANEEVVISDHAVALQTLRAEIDKAEDEFYAAYNALMKDRDFKVTCSTQAQVGTRIERKICRPGFVENIAESHSNHWGTGGGAVPPDIVLQQKYPVFRQKMTELVKKTPMLSALLEKRGLLQARYDELTKGAAPAAP